MPDVPDYDLVTPARDPLPPPPPKRPVGLWIVGAALVCAIAIAAYIFIGGNRTAPARTTAQPPPATAAPPSQPLGGEADAIDVPPLEQSDPLVRQLVSRLSSNPTVAAWLATDGLIRNFTVVVANIAEGRTPARQLKALQPSGSFRVVERGGSLVIDPQSFERYDALAAAAASLDPAGSARLYAMLKPRIEDAYGELGESGTFDQKLERTIRLLLQTPAIDGPIRVEPRGIGYGFADPALEALAPAQKQLLRTGPRNMRTIQASLREIALALGIPASRLPPPRTP